MNTGVRSVAVLQARTGSARLPAKVLLPIGGVPVAVLAAKRAGNTGREVIVATSTEQSDDVLAQTLAHHHLRVFRGSLNNTLNRVVGALADFQDDTIVFRLTADNVFPDGAFLDELERDFEENTHPYLICNGEPSGLPYGMSVEVTRLKYLREADRDSVLAFDQEHVTPYVRRKYGQRYFNKYKAVNRGTYRCTIDCLDDYLNVSQVFADVLDPIGEPVLELVRRLEHSPFQPVVNTTMTSRLVFGGAQLGSNYGISNTTGQPDVSQCKHMLKTAIQNGVTCIDTARAYGNSEEMIGQSLKNGWEGRATILTKLAPLAECPDNASAAVLNAFVDASVFHSRASLGVRKLDVLMLHRWSHRSAWDGRVWNRLLGLRASGMIGELGVSVQNPAELSEALDEPDVSYIQVPFNLLDWRWDSLVQRILVAKTARKLVVHVRSALLQGLLSSNDEKHWRNAHVLDSETVRKWLADQVTTCKRMSISDLCLNYVNGLGWVDGIAVGMENMAQLTENINIFAQPPLSSAQVAAIQESRPKLSEISLNPALWVRDANV